MKLADEDESRLQLKKKKLASASQPTIKSHFTPLLITISMNKERFIQGIVQMVMSGVPLKVFLKVKDCLLQMAKLLKS